MCFKPCYKWITFNTLDGGEENPDDMSGVLNLVINGLPSILIEYTNCIRMEILYVLNLVINGLPSIL